MTDNDELLECPVRCYGDCPPCAGDWTDPAATARHYNTVLNRLVQGRRAVSRLLSARVLPQHYSLDLADAFNLPYDGENHGPAG